MGSELVTAYYQPVMSYVHMYPCRATGARDTGRKWGQLWEPCQENVESIMHSTKSSEISSICKVKVQSVEISRNALLFIKLFFFFYFFVVFCIEISEFYIYFLGTVDLEVQFQLCSYVAKTITNCFIYKGNIFNFHISCYS